jgi:hypothetical protein
VRDRARSCATALDHARRAAGDFTPARDQYMVAPGGGLIMRISNLALCLFALAALAACGGGDGNNDKVDAPKEIDAPPAAMLTCDSYCTRIMQNCTGTNQQYGSMADCTASCARYPLGALADTGGNTLGCRLYHAGAAMTGPDLHCRHAGPGGDTACGANCLGFCTLVLGSCTTPQTQQYGGDMATCMTACDAFPKTPAYNSMQTGGDTFACRLYHATVAASLPANHCAHTGAASDTCKP